MPLELQSLEPRLPLAADSSQQSVDIVAKSASWDAATDALTITYSKTAALPTPAAATGALFWATGPNKADIIDSNKPAYSFALNPSQGDTTLSIKRTDIAEVPLNSSEVRTTQATHMILFVDSGDTNLGGVIAESNEQNNLLPIERKLNVDAFLKLYDDRKGSFFEPSFRTALTQSGKDAVRFLLRKMRADASLDLVKDPRVAAYMLGTVKTETGNTFLPVKELNSVKTEQKRIQILVRDLYGPASRRADNPSPRLTILHPALTIAANGKPPTWTQLPATAQSADPELRNPNQVYFRDPARPEDIIVRAQAGGSYYVYRATDVHHYGRGYVQLTHDFNYTKWEPLLGVPAKTLLDNPDQVLERDVAYRIMSEGMRAKTTAAGSFTGRHIQEFINDTKTDYFRARRVINKLDRASVIALDAKVFEELLRDSTVPNKASANVDDGWMQFVTVGDAGNAADTSPAGYGGVAYEYRIGKYDVTIGQYTEFLNAVATTDTYSLYNTYMGTNLKIAGISRSGSSGSYTYAVMNNGGNSANRPITYVTWFDAARFANWMHNGRGTGSTETGAYTLNGATSGMAPAKSAGAKFYIPTENEWYKAAYYKGGGTNAGYWDYATKSDTAPGNTIGSGANQANYNNGVYSVTQSASPSSGQNYLTDVGAFTNSASFYGTFDQSGNVFQWNDPDGTPGSSRGLRGGGWCSGAYALSSSWQAALDPSFENFGIGFRLASPA